MCFGNPYEMAGLPTETQSFKFDPVRVCTAAHCTYALLQQVTCLDSSDTMIK